jgi:hypothetical protein
MDGRSKLVMRGSCDVTEYFLRMALFVAARNGRRRIVTNEAAGT